jgi:hypothetical protein
MIFFASNWQADNIRSFAPDLTALMRDFPEDHAIFSDLELEMRCILNMLPII